MAFSYSLCQSEIWQVLNVSATLWAFVKVDCWIWRKKAFPHCNLFATDCNKSLKEKIKVYMLESLTAKTLLAPKSLFKKNRIYKNTSPSFRQAVFIHKKHASQQSIFLGAIFTSRHDCRHTNAYTHRRQQPRAEAGIDWWAMREATCIPPIWECGSKQL